MKLNNKGMSIVEIVVTFALIMVMVVGMLTILFNYKDKASLSLEKYKMETFKNTLTYDIEKDILDKGVSSMDTGGECETITGLNKCVRIIFKDGSEKIFGTSKIDESNKDSIQNKYLYYDGEKYELKDSLPDSIPEGRSYLDFQTIEVIDGNILSMDSTVLDDGTNATIYSIDVYIYNFDFTQDFGIHIVTTDVDLTI